ncbi:MFS transporter [Candidatus Woesearchaeota archaeon]|nr:MFS transporter [Candidatus Woesearchaeota archaeon]
MKKEKPMTLTHEQSEKTKKYSIVDGSACSIMHGFGEQYVVPYAIRLGASNAEMSILSSIPYFVGSMSQVLGAKLTDSFRNRKKLVVWFAFSQAISLVPLFIVPLLTTNMLLLTLIFSLYLVFGNLGMPAWNSWMGDVVKADERAKYFSKRNRATIILLLLSILSAGAVLNYFDKVNVWVGFAILFNIAVIGKLVSFIFLIRQHEPTYIVKPENFLSFREFLKTLPHSNFGNFSLFRGLFSIAIMIAAPFFSVYMLKNLGFSYIQFTAIILAPMAARIFTLNYWGKYSEKFGHRNIMYVSIFLICLIPLNWFLATYFFSTKSFIFPLLFIAEFLSGFGWGGFELSSFNYMLETSAPEKRAKSFAYFNVFWGVGVLIGGLASTLLVKNLPGMVIGMNVLIFLFALSFITRLVIAVIFVPKIKEVNVNQRFGEGELFFEMVISKPMDVAIHKTYGLLNLAEQGIEIIGGNPAKRTIEAIKEPFEPLLDNVTYYLDGMAMKVETAKKNKKRKSKQEKE